MAKLKLPKLRLPRVRHLNKWTILALLSYFNILVLIPFFLGKKNSFVAYHSRQGLALFLFTAIGMFSFYLPYLPWLVILYVLVCFIYGLVNVLTSHEKPIPFIGKLAQ